MITPSSTEQPPRKRGRRKGDRRNPQGWLTPTLTTSKGQLYPRVEGDRVPKSEAWGTPRHYHWVYQWAEWCEDSQAWKTRSQRVSVERIGAIAHAIETRQGIAAIRRIATGDGGSAPPAPPAPPAPNTKPGGEWLKVEDVQEIDEFLKFSETIAKPRPSCFVEALRPNGEIIAVAIINNEGLWKYSESWDEDEDPPPVEWLIEIGTAEIKRHELVKFFWS